MRQTNTRRIGAACISNGARRCCGRATKCERRSNSLSPPHLIWHPPKKPNWRMYRMAEEEDVSATGAGSGDALAAQMAMGTANSAASEAYLRKHGTFLDLQIDNLKKLDEYE